MYFNNHENFSMSCFFLAISLIIFVIDLVKTKGKGFLLFIMFVIWSGERSFHYYRVTTNKIECLDSGVVTKVIPPPDTGRGSYIIQLDKNITFKNSVYEQGYSQLQTFKVGESVVYCKHSYLNKLDGYIVKSQIDYLLQKNKNGDLSTEFLH